MFLGFVISLLARPRMQERLRRRGTRIRARRLDDQRCHSTGRTTPRDACAILSQERLRWLAPLEPVLVSAEAIPDPSVLELKTTLKTTLNGNEMHSRKASNTICSVARVNSHLSPGTTLKDGTVAMTDTLGGMGRSSTSSAYLAEGDDLRIWISHGLGTLINSIVQERGVKR
jgi:hypothetical protein